MPPSSIECLIRTHACPVRFLFFFFIVFLSYSSSCCTFHGRGKDFKNSHSHLAKKKKKNCCGKSPISLFACYSGSDKFLYYLIGSFDL